MNKTIIIDINELNPSVRKAGCQENVSWQNRKRKIYDYEFLYCYNGEAHIQINHKIYNIKKGTLILIKPNTPHSFWINKNNFAKIYWVHFDFIYFNDIDSLEQFITSSHNIMFTSKLSQQQLIRPKIMFKNGFKFPPYIEIKNEEKMKLLFEKIINTFNIQNSLWRHECKILLLKIFNELNISEHHNYSDTDIVSIIQSYIKQNYYRDINLKILSKLVNLNEDYIGKKFKQSTGKTIITYINEYKIEKAKQLLFNTTLSIEDISE